MAEGHRTEGTAETEGTEPFDAAVQLTYRPQFADNLAGWKVRERIKPTGLVVRTVFLVLWVGQWLLGTVRHGNADVVSTVLFVFVTLLVWGFPRIQAAHVQRIIGWHGEYRTTVAPDGITCRTAHSTLSQQWSVFRGYRETAGYFVLLSRDPNILSLDVLPKQGASAPEDIDRLRALLDRHIARV
jgi:hypothetical protein